MKLETIFGWLMDSIWALALVLLILSLLVLVGTQSASAAEELARVVAVEGRAWAENPEGDRRVLECDSPIFALDTVMTGEESGLGIVTGDFYARAGADSAFVYRATPAGAPDLRLDRGHLRLVHLAGGQASNGALETPGARVADAGADSEALVFGEKVGIVSMLCGREQPLEVARVGDSTQRITTSRGECAIAKPSEPLYAAPASHDPLTLLADESCGPEKPLIVGDLRNRFTPYDVASMLPPVDAPPPSAPPLAALTETIIEPCSVQACLVTPQISVGPITPTGPPGAN